MIRQNRTDPAEPADGGPDVAVEHGISRLLDYPYKTVRLACWKCDRQERFSKDKLIAAHGAELTMLDLRPLIASCERRHARATSCGAFYPDLMNG